MKIGRKKSCPKLIEAVFALAVAFVVIAHFTVSAAVGVPKVLNYQGRLLDSSGNLLGGSSGTNYCFRFTIWNASSSGSQVWPSSNVSSTMTVNVKSGVFSVGVGDSSAGGDTLDFNFEDNDDVYLRVEVAGQSGGSCSGVSFEALSPRQRILSSGYAINAATLRGKVLQENATTSQIPALSREGRLVLGSSTADVSATSTNILRFQNRSSGDIVFFGSATGTITSTGTLTLAGAVNAGLLSVTGTSTINGALTATGTIAFGTTTQQGIFHVATGTTNVLVISSAGNVGIGTTNPDPNTVNTKLNVFGSSNSSVSLEVTGNQADADATVQADLAFSAASNTTGTNGTRIALIRALTAGTTATNRGGALAFYTKSDDSGLGERMRILNGGNVGIGTTTPSATLHVIGSTTITNALTLSNLPSGFLKTISSGLLSTSTIDFSSDTNTAAGAGIVFSGDSIVNNGVLSLTGTANQITVSSATGTITLSLPQNISSTSTPTLGGLTVNGNLTATGTIAFGTTTQQGIFHIATGTTNALVVDSSGNVGIGTASPGAALAVTGSTTVSNSLTVDTNTLFVDSVNDVVGIGTAGPNGKLDVNQAVSAGSIALRLRNGNTSTGIGGNQIVFSYDTDTQWAHAIKTRHNSAAAAGNAIDFYTWQYGVDAAGAIGTQHGMTITNGNVGIGTTNPTHSLTVQGSSTIAGALTATGTITFGTTTQQGIFHVATGTTNALVMSSAGKVGIGTTSPSDALEVVGDIKTTACASDGTGDVACVDVAESYMAGENLEAGDIVGISAGSGTAYAIIRAVPSLTLAGIISTRPGLYLEGNQARFGGPNLPGKYNTGEEAPLALVGRVPVKVNLENGPIAVGDKIAVSSVPGVGKKASEGESSVGVALEEFGENGSLEENRSPGVASSTEYGKILVFVKFTDKAGSSFAFEEFDALEDLTDVLYAGATNALDYITGELGNGVKIIKEVIAQRVTAVLGVFYKVHTIEITASEAEFGELKVGSREKPAGVTLYDTDTGNPYCLYIRNGMTQTRAGACDDPNGYPLGKIDRNSTETDGDVPTENNTAASEEQEQFMEVAPPQEERPPGPTSGTTSDSSQAQNDNPPVILNESARLAEDGESRREESQEEIASPQADQESNNNGEVDGSTVTEENAIDVTIE